jgi:polyhydroxybutyrate depolymerase
MAASPTVPSTPAAPSDAPPPAPAGGSTPGSAEPDPSAGCTGGSLVPGRTEGTMMHAGEMRTFIQYVPPSYDGKTPVPFLFDLHGGGSNAEQAESLSGFEPLADTEGYIWLAPNSVGGLWSATDDKDELFLRALLTQVEESGCIDKRRVYSTGCSMGAGQTMWMACHAADIIAAVAPLCGTSLFNLETGCMPSRPISVMFSMGDMDMFNCWDEGEGPNGMPCGKSLQMTMKRLDMCTGEIEKTHNDVCETIGQCAEDTEVTICKVRSGHVLYQNPDLEIAKEHWAFLKRFYIH